MVRAAALADHHDVVNIRDKDGHSTWPEKNTEEHIDTVLRKISAASAQKEYYNNPVTEGEVFKEITYGRIPELKKFQFLVIYGDPAPGENKSKNSSTKSCILMGQIKQKVWPLHTPQKCGAVLVDVVCSWEISQLFCNSFTKEAMSNI